MLKNSFSFFFFFAFSQQALQEVLANLRKFVVEKNYVDAFEEAMKLNSTPISVQHYQPMGILNISFDGHDEKATTNYKRKLSMDSALV